MTELATPHIAGYSTDGKANGAKLTVQAVSAYFDLGLNDWEPENVPPPSNSEIILDCTDMDPKEIIREVFLNTYDIRNDDIKLRESPEKFEEFRNCYQIRREGVAYSLKLINNRYPHLEDVFEKLGYQVLEMNCF
jgi:erythronate-4-phosphate dehydrogenase